MRQDPFMNFSGFRASENFDASYNFSIIANVFCDAESKCLF